MNADFRFGAFTLAASKTYVADEAIATDCPTRWGLGGSGTRPGPRFRLATL